ncbi:restriction endonuclease subunit S [Georgenia sp. MJ173]|uniref:restriction endonuclease subunit S n=1 Tax=Georgenia sunbinii TaxID=3117728 RepID=UPI002F262800
MIPFVALSELLVSSLSGYWGSDPGTKDVDVKIIRNGDVKPRSGVRWDHLPLRGVVHRELQKASVFKDDLLLTTSGDCGVVAMVEREPVEPTVASNFIRILRFDREKSVPRYVYWYMQTKTFRNSLRPFIRGTTMKNLSTRDAFPAVQLPMPPLVEQRRIATILDRADELRSSRSRSINQLDELLESSFHSTLADRSADWTIATVADIAAPGKASIRTGPFGSQLLHSEFVDEGIAVLGIDNAVNNEFCRGAKRYITPEKYEGLRRYTVRPGDVIVTIMGTCGRSAIVPDGIPLAINTKHLCCITVDRSLCLPEFLHASLLWQPLTRSHLARSTKGAIMAGLNMGIIKSAPLVLPPLEVQTRIADQLEYVRQEASRNSASLAAMDELFASLQDRAFSGVL